MQFAPKNSHKQPCGNVASGSTNRSNQANFCTNAVSSMNCPSTLQVCLSTTDPMMPTSAKTPRVSSMNCPSTLQVGLLTTDPMMPTSAQTLRVSSMNCLSTLQAGRLTTDPMMPTSAQTPRVSSMNCPSTLQAGPPVGYNSDLPDLVILDLSNYRTMWFIGPLDWTFMFLGPCVSFEH